MANIILNNPDLPESLISGPESLDKLGKLRVINILSTKFVQNCVSIIADQTFQLRWLHLIFQLMAITLGGLHTWAAATSYSMNPDGIAYLDMGEAYLRGDWSLALNAYWSPFYALLLGLAIRLSDPSIRWEFPIVQLVNFLIYLGTLASFEFFWRQLTRYWRSRQEMGDKRATLPEWAWFALGYTLFIWSSLNLIEMWSVTPDMAVAAFVYLTAGFILSIRLGVATWRTFALLGIVLGLGYLTKAVMFPLAFVFLGIGLLSVGNFRRAVPLILVALGFFILIASPFIVALSLTKGRPTFGDSGKLNYARYVNGLPDAHWQGEFPGNGAPIHPTRKIFDAPAIFEFATPIGGTYPPWYDPSYWYEGVALHFDLKEQISVLVPNVLFYFDLFFRQQGGLLVGVLIFYLMGYHQSLVVKDIVRRWGLLLPALAAFVLYALVYVETRYLSPFVVLLWADLLVNVRLPASESSRRLVSLVSVTMILFVLMNIVAFNLEGFGDLLGRRSRIQLTKEQAGPPNWPGEVAEELHRLGLQAGDSVAVIGYGFDSFWARLARVKIVAELLDTDAETFWTGDSSVQSDVILAFSSTGARAIVAESVPSYTSLSDWHQVGNSNYYIYLLGE